MTKEQLESIGLDEAQIKEVFKLNGIAVENAKGDLSTKETELATTKKLLVDANKKIEGFKDMNIDDIKQKVIDYKKDYEALEIKSKEDLDLVEFNHELEGMARDFKARNIQTVLPLLNREELQASKNRKEDMKKAFETIATDNGYLFDVEEDTKDKLPTFTRPNTGGTKIEVTKESILAIKDGIERKRQIASNMELFNK